MTEKEHKKYVVTIKTYAPAWFYDQGFPAIDNVGARNTPVQFLGGMCNIYARDGFAFEIHYVGDQPLIISLHVGREFMTQAVTSNGTIIFDSQWECHDDWVCQRQTNKMPEHLSSNLKLVVIERGMLQRTDWRMNKSAWFSVWTFEKRLFEARVNGDWWQERVERLVQRAQEVTRTGIAGTVVSGRSESEMIRRSELRMSGRNRWVETYRQPSKTDDGEGQATRVVSASSHTHSTDIPSTSAQGQNSNPIIAKMHSEYLERREQERKAATTLQTNAPRTSRLTKEQNEEMIRNIRAYESWGRTPLNIPPPQSPIQSKAAGGKSTAVDSKPKATESKIMPSKHVTSPGIDQKTAETEAKRKQSVVKLAELISTVLWQHLDDDSQTDHKKKDTSDDDEASGMV